MVRILVFSPIFIMALVRCFGQEGSRSIEYYDGSPQFKEITTYPDGSYFLRIMLYDQQREESGFFKNGIWTVQGKVIWYNPERTNKHTDYIEDGNIAKSTNEQESRPQGGGLSAGCVASLCG